MKTIQLLIASSMLIAATPVAASEALAKSKGCTACHSIGGKLVGPAYKDVAAKYKADKEAAAKLQASVVKGSQGKWGPIPMPANKVTEDEAKALVAWILAL